MPSNEEIEQQISSVMDAATVGHIRVCSNRGNAMNLLCRDGEKAYRQLKAAMDGWLGKQPTKAVEIECMNETRQTVMVYIHPAEISAIFKFPPPSNLALVGTEIRLPTPPQRQ